jgi:hypothetical protein
MPKNKWPFVVNLAADAPKKSPTWGLVSTPYNHMQAGRNLHLGLLYLPNLKYSINRFGRPAIASEMICMPMTLKVIPLPPKPRT